MSEIALCPEARTTKSYPLYYYKQTTMTKSGKFPMTQSSMVAIQNQASHDHFMNIFKDDFPLET